MLMGVMLSGCALSRVQKLDKDNNKPLLIHGAFNQAQDLCYKAAKIAFPEVPVADIHKTENGINIDRYWFWRGDSTIVVTLRQINKDNYTVEAKSKQNWKRGNACLFPLSESKYYISILHKTYQNENKISKNKEKYDLYLKLKKEFGDK